MRLTSLTTERLTTWILFILIFVMAVRIPTDTDTWWHLRSGEWMVQKGQLLQEDLFSHTRDGQSWINHSWASQIVMYSVYKLSGGNGDPADRGVFGLSLWTAALAVGGMYFVYRMCAGNVYSRMFVIIIGTLTAALFWTARPQMTSFFLSAVVLYLLYLYKHKNLDRLWIIPLLMVLWVNLHGGFAIGFIFLFGFIIGEVAARFLDASEALSLMQLRKVVIISGISLLALSLNPYGPQMILYPLQTASIGVLNNFIQEWRSPDFKVPLTWAFILLLTAPFVLAARTQQPIPWSDLALFCGTAFLALWAARNVAVFAVVATPIFSRQLDLWLTQRQWQIKPATKVSPSMLRLNWLLLIVVLIGAVAQIATTLNTDNVTETQQLLLPSHAVQILKDETPTGPLLNDYNWGGYLIFALRDYPVFVDGRTDLYTETLFKDYLNMMLGDQSWRENLDKYNIQLVLIHPDSPLATLLRENPDTWEILFEEEGDADEVLPTIIFRRVPTPTAEITP